MFAGLGHARGPPPIEVGEDEAYIAESSSSVIDVDKCVAAVCRVPNLAAITASAVGQALIHHLVKSPEKLVNSLLSRVFDVRTRQSALRVVAVLVKGAVQHPDGAKVHGPFLVALRNQLRQETGKEAALAASLAWGEVGKALASLATSTDRTAPDDALLGLEGAVRPEPVLPASLPFDEVKEVLKALLATSSQNPTPTKLTVAAADAVGYLLVAAGTAQLADRETELLWDMVPAMRELLSTLRTWYSARRHLLAAVCGGIQQRLEVLCRERSRVEFSLHRTKASDRGALRGVTEVLGHMVVCYMACLPTPEHPATPAALAAQLSTATSSAGDKAMPLDIALRVATPLGAASKSTLKDFFASYGVLVRETGFVVYRRVLPKHDEIVEGDAALARRLGGEVVKVLVHGGDAEVLPGGMVEGVRALLLQPGGDESVTVPLVADLLRQHPLPLLPDVLGLIKGEKGGMALAALRTALEKYAELRTNRGVVGAIVAAVVQDGLTKDSHHLRHAASSVLSELPPEEVAAPLLRRVGAPKDSTRGAAKSALRDLAKKHAASSDFISTVLHTAVAMKHEWGAAYSADGTSPRQSGCPATPADIAVDSSPSALPHLVEAVVDVSTVWGTAVTDWPRVVGPFCDILLEHPTEELVVKVTATVLPVAARSCPHDVLVAPAVQRINHLVDNPPTTSDAVFTLLAPLLLLRPLPPQAFSDQEALRTALTRYTVATLPPEVRRLAWELLARVRPSVATEVLRDLDCLSNLEEVKLRVLYLCALSTMPFVDQWEAMQCAVEKVHAIATRMGDEKLWRGATDLAALTTARELEMGRLPSWITDHRPPFVLSTLSAAVGYLRSRPTSALTTAAPIVIPPVIALANTLVANKDNHHGALALATVFNVVHASQGTVAPYLIPAIADVALSAMCYPNSHLVRHEGTKLMGAVLTLHPDIIAQDMLFLPRALDALRRVADGGDNEQATRELAAKLLGVLHDG